MIGNTKRDRWMPGRLLMLGACLTAMLCTRSMVTAQDDRRPPEIPLETIIATYVDAAVFDDMIKRLDLDDAAGDLAAGHYGQYEEGVRTLHAEVQRRVVELFTEEELNTLGAIESKGQQRVLGLMRAMQRVFRSTQTTNREMLISLRLNMHEVVGDDGQDQFDRAWLDMMRTLHLRPLNEAGPAYDMSRHVDLVAHWSDATSPDATLARLHPDAIVAIEDDDERAMLQQVGATVREHLDAYAREINVVVEEADYRPTMLRLQMQANEAKLLSRENTLRDLADQQRSLWMRIYEPTEQHARAIARTIEPALGPDAARAWLDSFYRGVFPELMGPVSSELLYDWAMRRDDLTEQQRKTIEHLYDLYLTDREHWRERARTIRLRRSGAASFRPSPLGALMPEELQPIEQMREELAERFNDALRDLLTDEQAAAFDRERQRITRYAEVGVILRH